MKVRGVLVDEDQFNELCREHGITNPDWIDGVINEFENKSVNFIEQAIESFNDWVATEGNSNPGDKRA